MTRKQELERLIKSIKSDINHLADDYDFWSEAQSKKDEKFFELSDQLRTVQEEYKKL